MIDTIREAPKVRLLCILLTVSILFVDILWLPRTSVEFDWRSAVPGLTVAIILAIYGAFYTYIRTSERIASMAIDGSILILFSQIGCVYGYLIATSPYPLQDELLISWDSLIGFDWLAYNQMVFSSNLLRNLSLIFYNITLPLVIFTFIGFSLTGRTQRSREFVLSIIIGAIVCISISWFFPAVGAVGFYAPDEDFYNGLIHFVDVGFKQDYLDLRAGEVVTLSMAEPKGLVAFPSYHVCMAVLTVLAYRDHPKLLWIVASISFATILSTPIDGGHHLSDSIGGVVVGILCFMAARYFASKERAPTVQVMPLQVA